MRRSVPFCSPSFIFYDSIFFLFEFVTSILGNVLFRGLAAAFKSEAPAQALAGVIVLAVSLYGQRLISYEVQPRRS